MTPADQLTVAYHTIYGLSLGADRWIADAWLKGFRYHGIRASGISGASLAEIGVEALQPDLLMTDIGILRGRDLEVIRRLRARGTKLAVWIHWPLAPTVDATLLPTVLSGELADAWYGEREPDCMGDFESATGQSYLHLPQAASHLDHFPVENENDYAFDIAFVGAKLPRKRWFNELLTKRLVPRYRVGIFGPGWTLSDNIKRVVTGSFKRAGLFALAGAVDRRRIQLPLDKERMLYSSSKISLNFHERDDDLSISHSIVNQRTFKICASGGFQIVDDVPGIRRQFSEDELVALPPDERLWLNTIEYYLSHDAEREAIRRRGIARARGAHYSYHRVATLLRHLGLDREVRVPGATSGAEDVGLAAIEQ